MDIIEMHKLFRILGQQMGMLTVRGILSESIDAYLNEAIIEKVRNILVENSIVDFKNKVAIQTNNINPINALRTLYKEVTLESTTTEPTDVMVYVGASVTIDGKPRKCRVVDPTKVEDLLNDYCNKPSNEYPIVVFNGEQGSLTRDVYTDIHPFTGGVTVKYIELPKKVNYSSSPKVSCNLPEYLHTEIVNSAVTKYFRSVGYTTPQAQNNENINKQ